MGHKRRSLLKQYNSFVWGTGQNLSHYSLINFPSVSCWLLQNKTEFRVTWSVQLVNKPFFWTGSLWWIGWFVCNSVHFTNTMIQNQQLTEGKYYQWITALNLSSFSYKAFVWFQKTWNTVRSSFGGIYLSFLELDRHSIGVWKEPH